MNLFKKLIIRASLAWKRITGDDWASVSTEPGALVIDVHYECTTYTVRVSVDKLDAAIAWMDRQPFGEGISFRGKNSSWLFVPAHLVPVVRKHFVDMNSAHKRGSTADLTDGKDKDPRVNSRSTSEKN